MDNALLIQKFYNSFAAGDSAGMVDCYADDIEFQDPAFGPLKGEHAKNMWRMLLKTLGINITVSNIKADDQTGSADWVAEYIFSLTGKKVVNKVHADFIFNNGKIIRHTDYFSFWKWASQAFSFKGILLGWTPLMKNKVREQALARLGKFENEINKLKPQNAILNKYKIQFTNEEFLGRYHKLIRSPNLPLDMFLEDYNGANLIQEFVLSYLNSVLLGEEEEVTLVSQTVIFVRITFNLTYFYQDFDYNIEKPDFLLPTLDFKQIVEAWLNYVSTK